MWKMSQIERIEALFHHALTMPAGSGRLAWIEAECGSDKALRDEVLSLLQSKADMDSVSTATPRNETAIPEAQFGPYRVIEWLAHGGMSSVYRAERADGSFHQVVALKVMARWLASPDFLTRFEAERQFLASLEHPNITRLLDGGVSSAGDPYLITEFVDGEPIDKFCDGRKMRVEDRLGVFLQLCEAVDYAHRNLIVHRDLKPANILVNRDGVVKLLDFGTASLAAGQAGATITRMRMMTPHYASPEQLRGERAGVSSDVFSLGVILYELLTGAWPFGSRDSLLSELSRATGEASATAPSMAVSAEAAERRSAPESQLRNVLKGDLSAIVLKAMENNPAQRYASVRQFADDIEAYRERRPVRARRQTVLYRTGRFLSRRWLPVGVVAVLSAGILTATGVAIYQARAARQQAARAERISKFAKDTFLSASPAVFSPLRGQNRAIQFTDILDNAADRVGVELKNDPVAEADLRGTIASTYSVLGDPVKGEAQLRRAIERLEQTGNATSAIGADMNHGLCMALSYRDQYQEALAACRKAVGLARIYGSDQPLAGLIHDTAFVTVKSGARLEEAEALYREALALPVADKNLARLYPAIINTRIASLRLRLGDLEEAESLLAGAERRFRAEPGPPLEIIPTLAALSTLARTRGEYPNAVRLLQETVDLLTARPAAYFSKDQIEIELAAAEAQAGDPGSLKRVRRVQEAVLSSTVAPAEIVRNDLLIGIIEARYGSRERAEALFRSGLELGQRQLSLQPSAQVEIYLRLAQLLSPVRQQEAAEAARQGLETARIAYGKFFDRHPFVTQLKGIR